MDFKSPVVPISGIVRNAFGERAQVRAHFADKVSAPYILIKGAGSSTIQILVRHKSRIEALELVEEVGNYLKASFPIIPEVNIFDIDFQSDPTPSEGEGGSYEAWAYMTVNYFES